jgi:hypothetical protein
MHHLLSTAHLTTWNKKHKIFWDVMPCSLVENQLAACFLLVVCLVYLWPWRWRPVNFSKTLENLYQTIWCHIFKDSTLHTVRTSNYTQNHFTLATQDFKKTWYMTCILKLVQEIWFRALVHPCCQQASINLSIKIPSIVSFDTILFVHSWQGIVLFTWKNMTVYS